MVAATVAALAIRSGDSQPTATPVGVAFVRHDGNRLVDWHGRVGDYDPYSTVWSPSGRFVARYYADCQNGNCERWFVVTRADGADRHVLPGPESGVSWSRDESALTYLADGGLSVADRDGSNVHTIPLTVPGCGADCHAQLDRPALSPDGTTIAVLVTTLPAHPLYPPKNPTAALYTVPASGGTASSLDSDQICPSDTTLDWSADGSWIAYVANICDNTAPYTLETVNVRGVQGISVPLRGRYAWSPVGEILAYTTRAGVALTGARTIRGATSPSWQPGRNRLAVEIGGWIAVLDAPGAQPRRLWRGGTPAWTTHGLAYSAQEACGPRQGIWLAGRRLTNRCEVDGTRGTPWPDEVWAIDHRREHVSCGAGFDVAHVDPHDVVAHDCERVLVRR